MKAPDSRRVTAGLVADLADDPELADTYVSQYLAPRRAQVWQLLQRGIDRGELAADVDLAFIYDLLIGPLFMRAVVWGQPLAARRRRANRRCDPRRLRPKRQRTPNGTTNLNDARAGICRGGRALWTGAGAASLWRAAASSPHPRRVLAQVRVRPVLRRGEKPRARAR